MPTRRAVRHPVPPKLPADLVPARLSEVFLAEDGVCLSTEYGGGVPAGSRADGLDVERCRFDTVRLAGAVLPRASLSDTEFLGCDLANIDVSNGVMATARLERCRLTGATWGGCSFRDVVFEGCRADLARFRMSRFRHVVFRDCNLTEADFQSAEFTGCRFEDCRMEGVRFSQAVMTGGVVFSGCDLWGLSGVESLRGATVQAADAQGLVHTLAASLGITIEE
ncbi:pentapeptide repeat-containing protein [Actinoallomurus acaciae]|uniref:Pentapeptide repeat-containing protein n=1 Tax=Actinoallomurus acaciae TaxID=502577 RepID=A0ABV5YGP4_9ACTN